MAVSSVQPRELPIDAVEEILVHLKVKDLIRYKSVCRSWLALIDNPRFIEKHLLVQKSRREETKIIATTKYTFDEDEFLKIYSLSPKRYEPQICAQPPLDRNVRVVGSCNGLLCLLSEPDRKLLYVCNPSTRERPRTCYIASTYVKGIGFGYDETRGDYKVVKISTWEENYSVEVWSMRTHGWRQIDSSFFEMVRGYNIESSLFVGRNLYWLARSDFKDEDPIVVSFDMGDETFRAIEIPDAILDRAQFDSTIVDFMGSLALLVKAGTQMDDDYCSEAAVNLFDLWVLRDGDYIWTLKFRIALFRRGCASLTGLCIDGNLLFQYGQNYILHNPRTNQKDTEIQGPPYYEDRQGNGYYIDSANWSFVESLVRTAL